MAKPLGEHVVSPKKVDAVLQQLARLTSPEASPVLETVARKVVLTACPFVAFKLQDAIARALEQFLCDLDVASCQVVAAQGSQEPVFFLDAAAAAFVMPFGDAGNEYAETLIRNAGKRFEEYCPIDAHHDEGSALLHIWQARQGASVPRFVEGLAKVLWSDVLHHTLIKEPNAMSAAVVDDLIDLMRPGITLGDDPTEILTREGNRLRRFRLCRLATQRGYEEGLSKNLGLLATVNAHRLIRFLVAETRHLRNVPGGDYHRIDVRGGWRRLAYRIGGGGSKQDASNVKRIVRCLSFVHASFPDSEGPLLAYSERKGGPGQPSVVTITPNEAFLPDYVAGLRGRTARHRTAKLLVPIPPLPPQVGRQRDWGAQANLQMALMRHLHSDFDRLSRKLPVAIGRATRDRLADCAGLARSTVPRVLRAWCSDGADHPAFIRQTSMEHYEVSEAYRFLWDYLVDGARRRWQGHIRGTKGMRAKKPP